MKGEIVSLELAVGAAAFVLGARLFSLIQATRGVPDAHNQILEAVAGGDFGTLTTRTRGLGYQNPYGEVAAELIQAHQREGDAKRHAENIKRAGFVAEKRLIRRTRQGQALDLAALAIASGVVVFSRSALPAEPLFWSLGGAVIVLLLSSLAARAQLKASVLNSLTALHATLATRPQLPSLTEENLPCFWCGGKTLRDSFEVRAMTDECPALVQATYCGDCGKFVTTLDVGPQDSEVSQAEGVSHVDNGPPPSSESDL